MRCSPREALPFTCRCSADSNDITLRRVAGPNWPSAVVA
jgi:hypothetical protein